MVPRARAMPAADHKMRKAAKCRYELWPTSGALCFLAGFISIASVPAKAQPVQVTGKFGYLSEYELTANFGVGRPVANGEYSGPMIVRHVGLCTHDGPNQEDGQIRLKLSGTRITGILSFGGRECYYRGKLSDSDVGEMNCPGAPAVPISIWSK
jgi:hypothetical protein